MSEILTDLLPTETAVQAKYLRMFLIGLMLQLVLRFRPEGLLPEDPTRHRPRGSPRPAAPEQTGGGGSRSEEHTSELQSLMRIPYAVFCLKKKTKHKHLNTHTPPHTNQYTQLNIT